MKFYLIMTFIFLINSVAANAVTTEVFSQILGDKAFQDYATKNLPEGGGDEAYHFSKLEWLFSNGHREADGTFAEDITAQVTYAHNYYKGDTCEVKVVYTAKVASNGTHQNGRVTSLSKSCN